MELLELNQYRLFYGFTPQESEAIMKAIESQEILEEMEGPTTILFHVISDFRKTHLIKGILDKEYKIQAIQLNCPEDIMPHAITLLGTVYGIKLDVANKNTQITPAT